MIGKTGRNDPCPCGSGNKYKNCCLNSSRRSPGKKLPQSLSHPSRFFSIALNAVFLIVMGLIAYHNSFKGVFVFDDSTIRDTPQIHHLWPIVDVIKGANRPLLNLSLAMNYAFGGMDVWGYHVFNLFIHISATVVLFGLIRWTLLSPRLYARYGHRALELSMAVALLWLVHPLNTGAVTYTIQRTESMMGLFFLLTMYCSARMFTLPRHKWWGGLAVISCVLGMASKEVMVTAPLLVFLYDRTFFAESFRELFSRRWRFYLALFSTWGLLVFLITHAPGIAESAGFDFKGFTPLDYALTQPGIILHYIKLAFFPTGLCLDYQWPIARKLTTIVPPLLVILTSLVLTAFSFRRRPELGFLGAWFFIILSVSSSFIPIQDLAFEHRMYLSLIAIIALIVFAADYFLQKFISADSTRRVVGFCLLITVSVFLTRLTLLRNEDYANEITMWKDVIQKRPGNVRAHNDLGLALVYIGDYDQALFYLSRALEMRPNYPKAYNNIGLIKLYQGDLAEAKEYFSKALEVKPDYAEVRNNLGLAFLRLGEMEKAEKQYRQAIDLEPDYAEPYNNLGIILFNRGQFEEAKKNYFYAIKLKPHYETAYNNIGIIYIHEGRLKEAKQYFTKALSLKPDYSKARNNLGVVFKQQGKYKEALSCFSEALRLEPGYEQARKNFEEVSVVTQNVQKVNNQK